jgi:hypothetical protein
MKFNQIIKSALVTLSLCASVQLQAQDLPPGGAYICQNSQAYYVYWDANIQDIVRIPVSRKCRGTGFLI